MVETFYKFAVICKKFSNKKKTNEEDGIKTINKTNMSPIKIQKPIRFNCAVTSPSWPKVGHHQYNLIKTMYYHWTISHWIYSVNYVCHRIENVVLLYSNQKTEMIRTTKLGENDHWTLNQGVETSQIKIISISIFHFVYEMSGVGFMISGVMIRHVI